MRSGAFEGKPFHLLDVNYQVQGLKSGDQEIKARNCSSCSVGLFH